MCFTRAIGVNQLRLKSALGTFWLTFHQSSGRNRTSRAPQNRERVRTALVVEKSWRRSLDLMQQRPHSRVVLSQVLVGVVILVMPFGVRRALTKVNQLSNQVRKSNFLCLRFTSIRALMSQPSMNYSKIPCHNKYQCNDRLSGLIGEIDNYFRASKSWRSSKTSSS